MTATADIPGFIHGLKPGSIPPEVFHMSRRCLVDTLAVWAAGAATEPGRIARAHAARRYPGDLPLPFDGRLVNPIGFAFAGAAAIDSLDGHGRGLAAFERAGVEVIAAHQTPRNVDVQFAIPRASAETAIAVLHAALLPATGQVQTSKAA